MNTETLTKLIEDVVYRILTKMGAIQDLVPRAEMYRRFGKKRVDQAIKDGRLIPHRDKTGGRVCYSINDFYNLFY